MVGSRDEFLEVSETVSLGKGKHQFCLNECLPCLLAGHLQVAHQVLKVFLGEDSHEGREKQREERERERERERGRERGRQTRKRGKAMEEIRWLLLAATVYSSITLCYVGLHCGPTFCNSPWALAAWMTSVYVDGSSALM